MVPIVDGESKLIFGPHLPHSTSAVDKLIIKKKKIRDKTGNLPIFLPNIVHGNFYHFLAKISNYTASIIPTALITSGSYLIYPNGERQPFYTLWTLWCIGCTMLSIALLNFRNLCSL